MSGRAGPGSPQTYTYTFPPAHRHLRARPTPLHDRTRRRGFQGRCCRNPLMACGNLPHHCSYWGSGNSNLFPTVVGGMVSRGEPRLERWERSHVDRRMTMGEAEAPAGVPAPVRVASEGRLRCGEDGAADRHDLGLEVVAPRS